MNGEALIADFRRKVSQEIDVQLEGIDRYIVYTPFMFDDGDHFVVLLRKENSGWFFTDAGHTLMHLSYSGVDLGTGIRARIIEESLAAHGVENQNGELRIAVTGEEFGDALYSYLEGLSKITTVTHMTRERVASTFVEDFSELLTSIAASRVQLNWHDAEHDPDRTYSVDCRINGSPIPCFVFAINSTGKCSHATITCLTFEKWSVPFRSVALFEDQEKIGRKELAQLTNVVGRQFPSLGDRERIMAYFQAEVLAQRGS